MRAAHVAGCAARRIMQGSRYELLLTRLRHLSAAASEMCGRFRAADFTFGALVYRTGWTDLPAVSCPLERRLLQM